MKRQLEEERVEADIPVRMLQSRREREALAEQIETAEMQLRLRGLEVEGGLIDERARQALRREILPIEQAPELAQALSGLLRGANLSVYGEDTMLLSAIAPAVDMLVQRVGQAFRGASPEATPDDAELPGPKGPRSGPP